MPTFRVHVIFTVPAPEEQDAVNEINTLLEQVDAGGDYYDWEIAEVWDYDDGFEDDEDLVDEW